MADVIKAVNTLKIECLFVDGDTRTITLQNPDMGINYEEVIASLNTWMQNNQPLVGDKWQGAFGRIGTAKRVTVRTTYLDIG